MKSPAKARFEGVVSPSDSALSAARNILKHEYAIVEVSARALMDAPQEQSTAVHDLRVSGRRFRSAARLFKPLLQATDIKVCCAALKTLSDTLSPIRDSEVWLAFLDSVELPATTRASAELAALRDDVQRRYRRSRKAMAACLSGEAMLAFLAHAPVLLDEQLPDLAGPGAARSAAAHIAPRFRKRLAVLDEPMPDVRHMSCTVLHTLRKSVRQLRYWGEFSEPILEGPLPALTSKLKDAADGLGRVHDIDVHIEQIDAEDTALADLLGVMRYQREQGLELFLKRWKSLRKKSSRLPLDAFLKGSN
jgi:CHAD domain-containing protein